MTGSVDVIIPVHNTSRPVERAVESVTAERLPGVRVTVVCHGVDPQAVGDRVRHRSVRVISHVDGVASAAGPMNAGLAQADADYVSRLDSDDWFERGALTRWLAHADASSADVVIAPLRPDRGKPLYAPLTRPFRHSRLDGVRDRLAYRTAPFGLIRREALDRLDAGYTPGLRVGEDLEIGLKLWFLAGRIDLAVDAGSYVVGDDQTDRTTETTMTVAEELGAAQRLVRQEWVHSLDASARRSIAVKILRIHVLAAALKRGGNHHWSTADLEDLARVSAELIELSPSVLRPFSRADSGLLRTLADRPSEAELGTAIRTHAEASRLDGTLSATIAGNFDRESTIRRYVRYRLPR